MPRNRSRLDKTRSPSESTALLALRVDDVHVFSGPTGYLVRAGNAVLATLAGGRDSVLLPPERSHALFGSNGVPDSLLYEITSAAFFTNEGRFVSTNGPVAMASLEAFVRRTGIRQVVRTRLKFVGGKVRLSALDSSGDPRLWKLDWGGSVTVQMELVELLPPRRVGEATGRAEYRQYSGMAGLLPFYVGTTMGRAVDGATRQAMTNLFERTREQPVVVPGTYSDTDALWREETLARYKSRQLRDAQRSAGMDLTLDLKRAAVPARSIEPRAAGVSVRLVAVNDRRQERWRLGERRAAFDAKMGDIHASPSVPEYVRERIERALAASGHRVVNTNADVELTCDVQKLWLQAAPAGVAMDVTGEIHITVSNLNKGALRRDYSATALKRTYWWPTATLHIKVLEECVADVMRQFQDDPLWR